MAARTNPRRLIWEILSEAIGWDGGGAATLRRRTARRVTRGRRARAGFRCPGGALAIGGGTAALSLLATGSTRGLELLAHMNTVELPPAWGEWNAVDRATLVFIFRGNEVLLIRKRRGLGAGKINGPGGRLEAGESRAACARREVEEELCITPLGLEERGELRFQFTDGYSIHAFVFVASGYVGEPTTTPEAIPSWTPCDAIPYNEMWADDRYWMPYLLSGKRFRGRFVFDGDRMLVHELYDVDGDEPWEGRVNAS